jgi:hypothetical protein
MSRIKTFSFPESSSPAPDDIDAAFSPLTLSLSRKGSSYILVFPFPPSASSPHERQYAIINALVQEDPFPELSDEGRVRIWLKIGGGEQGGENEGLLDNLVQAGVVKE